MSEAVFKIGPWSFAVADDEPTANIQVAEWLSWGDSSTSRSIPRTRALVEIKRQFGGRNSRALLGGEYSGAGLHVRVAQSSWVGAGGERSCRSRLGQNLVPGLPSEFASTVLRTLVRELPNLGSGAVTIDRAAYDDVDSSPRAFEHVAIALLQLLHARIHHADEKQALQDVVNSW